MRGRGLADLEIGQIFAAEGGERRAGRRWTAARTGGTFPPAPRTDDMLAALTFPSFNAARARLRRRPPTRVEAYGAVFAISILSFLLAHATTGAAQTVFTVLGGAGCGWSWLLARALFDPRAQDALWPRIVVLLVWATSAILILTEATTPLLSFIGNLNRLTSSTVLLLTFIEPLAGYRASAPLERRYRASFAAGYAVLMGIAVLLVRDLPTGGAVDVEAIKTACAFAALFAGAVAVWFRLTHPLAPVVVAPKPPAPRTVTSEDEILGAEIIRVMRDGELYLVANLKVADLAAKLRQPEYKVSQAIVGALGFANFNRLANHFRIGRAMTMLADPSRDDLPILSIAMDCGFGSIGPFNRAFKEETGMTPSGYRETARSSTSLLPPLDGEGGLSAAKVGRGAREVSGRSAR